MKHEGLKWHFYLSARKCFFGADDILHRLLLLLPYQEADKTDKRVIFVIDSPSPRAIKMMKALNDNGWEIVSICRVRRDVNVSKEIVQYSTKVERYISAHGALFRCHKYRDGLFHVFCCYDYDVPVLLIKKRVGKVIFDRYDAWEGFVSNWNGTRDGRQAAVWEKYCMENADGLTCRSFESQYDKWQLGWRFKGKRLLFFDYCSISKGHYKEKHTMNDSPVFFYGGGLNIDTTDYVQSSLPQAADILIRNGCGFRAFGMMSSKKTREYFEDYAAKNPKFQFRVSVPFDEMIEEMRKYDFAIIPGKRGIEKIFKDNLDDGVYYGIKCKYASANKYFDALEAGIPIVSGGALYLQFKMLERDGMAVYCPVEELADKLPYLKEHYDELRANIEKNAEKYSIEKNIHRLIAFYEQIKAAPPIEIDK